jgi:hypothetical protein
MKDEKVKRRKSRKDNKCITDGEAKRNRRLKMYQSTTNKAVMASFPSLPSSGRGKPLGTIHKVSSLRDLESGHHVPLRKLTHTVNKGSSLRDFPASLPMVGNGKHYCIPLGMSRLVEKNATSQICILLRMHPQRDAKKACRKNILPSEASRWDARNDNPLFVISGQRNNIRHDKTKRIRMNKREIKNNQMDQINQNSDNKSVIAMAERPKQSLTINALLGKDCFATLAMTAWGNAMTALGGATFNFQLNKHF